MEVIGLIAAIPGLIEILKKTISIADLLIHKKTLTEAVTAVRDQLGIVEAVLDDVQKRSRTSLLSTAQLQSLGPHVTALRRDLEGLTEVLSEASGSVNDRKRRFFGQFKLAIKGCDTTIKQYSHRIENTKNTLNLILGNQVAGCVEESIAIARNGLRLQLQSTLSPCGDTFIPRRVDNTCDWIWRQSEFTQWIEQVQDRESNHIHRLFCLYGPKGCGKSVLSASITEAIRKQGKTVVFFSFWAGSEDQRTFTGLLRTILWQLLQHVSDEDIDECFHQLTSCSLRSEHELRAALCSVIKVVKSDIHLIIDGIDEARDDWNDSMSSGFKTILDFLREHHNIRVLLSGRESCLRVALSMTPRQLRIHRDLVKEDMDALIEKQLNTSTNTLVSSTKELIKETLQNKSELMFLWIILVFKGLNRCFSTGEITYTLDHVPRDLDREYCRLFHSFMDRSSGTSAVPSVSMKRAKHLLTIILASPEPLTLPELACAYAADNGGFHSCGHSALTRDALFDACGDFIGESDGRFHFAHASIAEFLTRPLESWEVEDREIIFFKLDHSAGQRMMFEACVNYLMSFDWGHPMYDENDVSLPRMYPFFAYASKFMPVHLLNIITTSFDSASYRTFYSFISSGQFCGLVEYAVRSIETNSWEMIINYMELLNWLHEHEPSRNCGALEPFDDLFSHLMASFDQELILREATFGRDDKRYQTWALITGFVATFISWNEKGHGPHQEIELGATSFSTSMPALGSDVKGSLVALQARLKVDHQRMIIAGMQPRFLTLVRLQPLKSLLFLSLDNLPIWMHISWAIYYWNGRDETLPVAKQMLQKALARVRKRRDLYESICLLYLAIMEEDCYDSEMHEAENCRPLALWRESLEIANNLKPSPQVEMVIHRALEGIADCLLCHDMLDEGLEVSHQLERRVCHNEIAQTASLWYKYIYQGRLWTTWRLNTLKSHSMNLRQNECFEDSERIIQFVLDSYAKRKRHNHPKMFSAICQKAVTLRLAGKVGEAEELLRSNLEELLTLKGSNECDTVRLQYILEMCRCLVVKEMHQEATTLLSKVDITTVLKDADNASDLLCLFFDTGCTERAVELYRCWTKKKTTKNIVTIYKAASRGVVEIVKIMLDMGANINAAEEESEGTALSCASYWGNVPVVQLLLERGANVHCIDRDGYTPLELALREGNVDVVQCFLNKGVRIDFAYGWSWYLFNASYVGFNSTARLLIDQGARIDVQNDFGQTPLMAASCSGHIEIIKILLDAGADIEWKDKKGRTALQWARSQGHDACVQLLLNAEGVAHVGD